MSPSVPIVPCSDQMGNKGSYIHLRGSDLRPDFHQFTAVVSFGGHTHTRHPKGPGDPPHPSMGTCWIWDPLQKPTLGIPPNL